MDCSKKNICKINPLCLPYKTAKIETFDNEKQTIVDIIDQSICNSTKYYVIRFLDAPSLPRETIFLQHTPKIKKT